MKSLIASLIILVMLGCKNRDVRMKDDINFILTNKTDSTIFEIMVNGGNGIKIWRLGSLESGKSIDLNINIKRDLKIPEGGSTIIARINNTDSVTLNTGYFTNWHYQGPDPTKFDIYSNRIELVE